MYGQPGTQSGGHGSPKGGRHGEGQERESSFFSQEKGGYERPDGVLGYLNNIEGPNDLVVKRAQRNREKYDQLLKAIRYNDCDPFQDKDYDKDKGKDMGKGGDDKEKHRYGYRRKYKYDEDFMPFVHFFKYLAKKPIESHEGGVANLRGTSNSNWGKLKLWIPDTIVVDDSDPIWIYSNPDGYVCRTDKFTTKHITSKLGSFSSPYELVAVLKRPQSRDGVYGNDLRLISSTELQPIVGGFMSSKSEKGAIQKFIKCIGPKAFICRGVWKKDNNHCAWVITNKNGFFDKDNLSEYRKYCTNPKLYNSATIVYTNRGRFIDNTIPYLWNIVKFLKDYAYCHLSELIGDFIEDESGIWWLINIRGFLKEESPGMNLKIITNFGEEEVMGNAGWTPQQKQRMIAGYQRLKTCKYCELLFPEDELTHKMTLKMIMQTDMHLQQRGKELEWLARPEYNKHMQLYQWHRVCQNCFELYQATVRLQEAAFKFARTLGLPLEEEKRADIMSLTTFHKAEAEKNERLAMPKDWHPDMGGNGAQKLSSKNQEEYDQSVPVSLLRYRMLIVFQSVREVPKDLNSSKNYYLGFTIFDTTIKYKLDIKKAYALTSHEASKFCVVIPVRKSRLFYFFTQKTFGEQHRKKIIDFLNNQKNLTVNLYCDADGHQNPQGGGGEGERGLEKIGTVDFPLNDFLSDKVVKREYFKFFSGKNLPILSWGLQATIGIIESGEETLAKSKLTDYKGIHLTTTDYFTCESFPNEWEQIFAFKEEKSDLKRLGDPKKETKKKKAIKLQAFTFGDGLLRSVLHTSSSLFSPHDALKVSGSFAPGDGTPTGIQSTKNMDKTNTIMQSLPNLKGKIGPDTIQDAQETDENSGILEEMLLKEIDTLERSLTAKSQRPRRKSRNYVKTVLKKPLYDF